MYRKSLISAFVLLNLATVLFMNRPAWLVSAGDRVLREDCPPAAADLLRTAAVADGAYARLMGLDNVWRLYSPVPRWASRHVLKAEYADSATVLLPLPQQSERTIWQRYFLDSKEQQFIRSTAASPQARQAYAISLGREYPEHNGSPIRSIVWEQHTQRILAPHEAARRGLGLEPEARITILDVTPCRPPSGSGAP